MKMFEEAKRGLKGKLRWIYIALVMLLLCLIGTAYFKLNLPVITSIDYSPSNSTIEKLIKTAIQTYIDETGDANLMFDGEKSVSKNEILLVNLQKQYEYNGVVIGPFLEAVTNPLSASQYLPIRDDKPLFWNILINNGKVNVTLNTSDKDIIIVQQKQQSTVTPTFILRAK